MLGGSRSAEVMQAPSPLVYALISAALLGACVPRLLPEEEDLDLVPESAEGLRPVFAAEGLPPVGSRALSAAPTARLLRSGDYGVLLEPFEGVAVYRFRDSVTQATDPTAYYEVAGLHDARFLEGGVLLARCGETFFLDLSGGTPQLEAAPWPFALVPDPFAFLDDVFAARGADLAERYFDCVDTAACIRTYERATLTRPSCVLGN